MMTHTYQLHGMTCGNCEARVRSALLVVPGVVNAEISLEKKSAVISMEKHVSLKKLQDAIGDKYHLEAEHHNETNEITRQWITTYKPVLLVLAYVTGISIWAGLGHGEFHIMSFMNAFMAAFFLSFSFFKFLDWKGFADSYATYDLVAKRWPAWGYLYPLVELSLGIMFMVGFEPLMSNSITALVMTISLAGVLKALMRKQAIRCACLGTVFNLPMSTITVLEDTVMIVMSIAMLFMIGS